jgi:tripeptide aminopeptidase
VQILSIGKADQLYAVLAFMYFAKKKTPKQLKVTKDFHVHLGIEETVLELIIRDHSKLKFEKRKLIEKIAAKNQKVHNLERDIVGTEIKDNMEGKIVPVKAYC